MAVTADDLTNQFNLLHTDPQRYLEMTEEFIRDNPSDSYGYFARHQAHMTMGEPALALADMNRSIELEPEAVGLEARGDLYFQLGKYWKAIEDYDRAEALDREHWEGGFGLLYRAACHARLGNEAAALADCARLPDDHWTPGVYGAPAGDKAEVAGQLRRIAARARRTRS